MQRDSAIQVFVLPAGFQYPLRVEVGCNLDDVLTSGKPVLCFSTLYGSKWVATVCVFVHFDNIYEFQYPLRVEVGCNCGYVGLSTLLRNVSVPSTGRSGLQPRLGSMLSMACPCFSTLYGSKWVATWNELYYDETSIFVSVPSTGRSGLQH